MKISELVTKLNEIKDEYGDLPVHLTQEWTSEVYEVKFWDATPPSKYPSCWGEHGDLVEIS